MSIQGNIKPMRSLAEPLQVAMDNGARKALIPLENKRNFLEVSGDVVERVDPVFFSDPTTAAMKVRQKYSMAAGPGSAAAEVRARANPRCGRLAALRHSCRDPRG